MAILLPAAFLTIDRGLRRRRLRSRLGLRHRLRSGRPSWLRRRRRLRVLRHRLRGLRNLLRLLSSLTTIPILTVVPLAVVLLALILTVILAIHGRLRNHCGLLRWLSLRLLLESATLLAAPFSPVVLLLHNWRLRNHGGLLRCLDLRLLESSSLLTAAFSPIVLLLDNWRLGNHCRLLLRLLDLRNLRLPLEESASLLAAALLLIIVLPVLVLPVLLTERVSFPLPVFALRIHLADLRTSA